MRSWLAVLLWVLLPLQLSWAAVGDGRCTPARHAFCQCTQTAPTHSQDGEAGAAHLACEVCHGQVHLAGPSPHAVAAGPRTTVFAPLAAAARASPPPSRPERPKWPA